MDIRNSLVPVAATPILQAILNFAGLLKLEPLSHWGWSEDILLPITYVVTTGSAAIACLWSAQRNRSKAILIGIGLVVLLSSLGTYTWVSTTPPADPLWLYDVAGYVSFFLTYSAFGFVVAHVVRFFAQKK
jgi:hypothetical protein